jgi:putative flavoprotein involved in K+ transport
MAEPIAAAPGAPASTAAPDAIVIGAGPGGLAAAAALRQRGLQPLVVERAERLGASWRTQYDRLHLHITRRLSALPGLPIPRAFGRWVGRDDVVRWRAMPSSTTST